MNILIASAGRSSVGEAGQSTDFAHSLARGLIALGHDARVALAAYASIENNAGLNIRPVIDDLALPWDDGSTRPARVWTGILDGVLCYLIGGEREFRRGDRLEGEEESVFFGRATQAALWSIEPRWLPEVVHIDDCCPGLAAVHLNALWLSEWDIDPAALVTTVQNGSGGSRANTLVTGSRLVPDVRVMRRYRSARRLGSEYERIYAEALSQFAVLPLAA